jgi:hypothetical protein
MHLETEVLKTLLYYDIWSHPLTERELFQFLGVNSMTPQRFHTELVRQSGNTIMAHQGYYFVKGKTPAVVTVRQERERHARRLWIIARLVTHIIKRFPFVRGVFVSGDLSKNATHAQSDIDFFIITEPGRLWIARTLLILFKKIVFFNRKKFFCLNYFTTTKRLTHTERNIYQATEVATLKPTFNRALFLQYMEANRWVNSFFPNFDVSQLELGTVNDRRSIIQQVLELPFSLFDASRLDEFLMHRTSQVWEKRYPIFDHDTRTKIFKCTRDESRAFAGNFEEKILALYHQRLKAFAIES